MPEITKELLIKNNKNKGIPYISLYQSTQISRDATQKNLIRFQNLVNKIYKELVQKYPQANTLKEIEPFNSLLNNSDFWNHTQKGLAIMSGPEYFKVIQIPQKLPELVVVAPHFHLQPLMRLLQSVDQFQLLRVTLEDVSLFSGNRHELNKIEISPKLSKKFSYVFNDNKKNIKNVKRYFRLIDQEISTYYSNLSNLPLILSTHAEFQSLFRSISTNPYLLNENINIDPNICSLKKLHQRAWIKFQPCYQNKIDSIRSQYKNALSAQMASDNLEEIAKSAVEGRVSTLIIEDGHQMSGRLNTETGQIEFPDLENSYSNDLLGDIDEEVTRTGGIVHILPIEDMPSNTGLAAIYKK